MMSIRLHKRWLPSAVGPLICMITRREDACKPGRCCLEHEYGPLVHLPYFWRQGSAVPQAQELPDSVPAALAIGSEPPAIISTTGRRTAAIMLASEQSGPQQESNNQGHEQSQFSSRPAGVFRRWEGARFRDRKRESTESYQEQQQQQRQQPQHPQLPQQQPDDQSVWSCHHCTFDNTKPHAPTCEACGNLRYFPCDREEGTESHTDPPQPQP